MGRPTTSKRFVPLWARVERNRVKLAVFMLAFALMWALGALAFAGILTVLVIVVVAVVAMRGGSLFIESVLPMLERVVANLPMAVVAVAGVGVLVSVAYAVRQLSIPPLMKLLALGAHRPDSGEYPVTKHALHDMSIAAGMPDKQPHLFVIDSSSVNAFMLARGDEHAYCVVTSGLAEKFDLDEQRAVFANLMVRLRAGDIQWGTVVSALMAPIWRWREADLCAEDGQLAGLFAEQYGAGDGATFPRYAGVAATGGALTGTGVLGLAIPVWFAYVAAVVASELVALGHRRSHLLAAEAADAEGMFLLKDPTSMLRTLKRAVEADNRMRVAAPLYAHLFYIWAGDDLIDEADPEWQRVRRLREVIGLFGIEDAMRGDDLVVEGLPPVAPIAAADTGTLPAPQGIDVQLSGGWKIAPLVIGLVALVLAGGRLFQVANFGQPLGAGPSSVEWAAFERAFLRAENVMFVVAMVSALFSAVVIARLWAGVAIAVAHTVLLCVFDLLAWSIPDVEPGRSLAAGLGVALGAAVIAAMGGAMLGSLVWGKGET